nr:hypothetical protein CFP56_16761 [Quercus suber]
MVTQVRPSLAAHPVVVPSVMSCSMLSDGGCAFTPLELVKGIDPRRVFSALQYIRIPSHRHEKFRKHTVRPPYFL